jgi:CubicO group peptidase (beta-lactamase class C family)
MRLFMLGAVASCTIVGSLQGQGPSPMGTVIAGTLGARLDSAVRIAERAGFSGVVRVSAGDSTLLSKGYGLANREQRIPFSPRTVVQIGSNTKDFTLVALLQLSERGLLGVRDSLIKFFPNAPADKRSITLAQVVDHTAGFPDFVGDAGDFEAVGRDDFLARLMTHPLESAPGTREHYSNAGYSLLAAIIEQLSGMSYDQYVLDHILAPVGMMNTGFVLPRFDEARLAHGYRNGLDIGTILGHPHPADGPYWMLRGNGGMLSMLDDMHAFYATLFTTVKLLRPETRALRFDPSSPIGLAGSDGTSFFVYERYPRLGFEILVASNSAHAKAPSVRRALSRVLGIAGDGGSNPAIPTNGSPVASPGTSGSNAPAAPDRALVLDFIHLFNGADPGALREFVSTRFAPDPTAPPLDQRIQRMVQSRANLGLPSSVTGVCDVRRSSPPRARSARVDRAVPDILGIRSRAARRPPWIHGAAPREPERPGATQALASSRRVTQNGTRPYDQAEPSRSPRAGTRARYVKHPVRRQSGSAHRHWADPESVRAMGTHRMSCRAYP